MNSKDYTEYELINKLKIVYRKNNIEYFTSQIIDDAKALPDYKTVCNILNLESIKELNDLIDKEIKKENQIIEDKDNDIWTKEEKLMLKIYYPYLKINQLTKIFERSVHSLKNKAKRINLKKDFETREHYSVNLTMKKTYFKSEIDDVIVKKARESNNLRMMDFDKKVQYFIKEYYGSLRNAKNILGIYEIENKNSEEKLCKEKFPVYQKKELIKMIEIISKVLKNDPKPNDFKEEFISSYEYYFDNWENFLHATQKDDTHYTRVELIEIIRTKAVELGRIPRSQDIKIPNLRGRIKNYFKNFNDLISQAGLESIEKLESQQSKKISRVELINILQEKYKQNKGKVFSSDFNQEFIDAYMNEFGSWSNFLRESEVIDKGRYTKEELIEIVKNRAEELGRRPKATELGISSYNAHIKKHFKNFNDLIKQCGFEVYGKYFYTDKGKQQIKDRLLDFYSKNGRPPTLQEMKYIEGIPNETKIKDIFNKDNWSEVLEEVLSDYMCFDSRINRSVTSNNLKPHNDLDSEIINGLKVAYRKNNNKIIPLNKYLDFKLPKSETLRKELNINNMGEIWNFVIKEIKDEDSLILNRKTSTWSKREEKMLEIYYPYIKMDSLAKIFNRGGSSIYNKAFKMKLKKEEKET